MQASHPPIRVLLVDDDSVLLWGLSKLINGEWPRMSVAGTASTLSAALHAAQHQKSDVVVLDLWLGQESSLDRLHEISRSAAAPVLVFAGSPDPELPRHALARGTRAVVMKHQPADVLLSEIERVYRDQLDREVPQP